MIVSIGVDIIEVYRIRETIERTPRFVERVFTENERAYCDLKRRGGGAVFCCAVCRERSVFEGFENGMARERLPGRTSKFVFDDLGAPRLKITNEALSLFENLGANKIHLSLSHTTEHAVAQVILEKV